MSGVIKKIFLSAICCFYVLSMVSIASIIHATDVKPNMDWHIVKEDIGTEAHMANADKLAVGEWWQLFLYIVVFTLIIVLTIYIICRYSIKMADVMGHEVRVAKIKGIRHIAIGVCVVGAIVGLVAIRIYTKPYNVKYESYAFNTMSWHELQNGLGDYTKTVDIKLDLVVRRSVLGRGNVWGTMEVNGVKYVVLQGNTIGDEDVYTISFAREGSSLLKEIGISLEVTKDFKGFSYFDRTEIGINRFVGPAETIEEAQSILKKFENK